MKKHRDGRTTTAISEHLAKDATEGEYGIVSTFNLLRNVRCILNNHGKSQIQIILILVALFAIMCSINGCKQQSATSGSAVYNMGDMADQMEVREDARLDGIRADVEVLERQYGNDRYLKDYSVISDRLNQEFRTKLEMDLQSKTKAPLMVRGEVTFFNDVLEEAEANNLSIDDLLKDTKRSIKDLDIYIDGFADIEEVTQYGLKLRLQGQVEGSIFDLQEYIEGLEYEFVESPNRHCTFTYKIVSKNALRDHSFDEVRGMENIDAYLYSGDWSFEGDSFVPNRSVRLFNVEFIQPILIALERRYNEKFVVYKVLNTFNFLCAPVKHPEMKFEVYYTSDDSSMRDQYLSVLTQANLNKQVDAILEKHGLSDRVVYLNAGTKMGWFDYDTSKLNGDIPFIEDEHGKLVDTSLYYLLQEGDQPDYEAIKEVVEDIQSIFPNRQTGTERVDTTFVFFYTLSGEEWPVLKALFQKDSLSMWKMPKDPDFLELEAFQVTDRMTDGFNYLYSKGIKEDYILSIAFDIKDISSVEMVQKYKRKDIWR